MDPSPHFNQNLITSFFCEPIWKLKKHFADQRVLNRVELSSTELCISCVSTSPTLQLALIFDPDFRGLFCAIPEWRPSISNRASKGERCQARGVGVSYRVDLPPPDFKHRYIFSENLLPPWSEASQESRCEMSKPPSNLFLPLSIKSWWNLTNIFIKTSLKLAISTYLKCRWESAGVWKGKWWSVYAIIISRVFVRGCS